MGYPTAHWPKEFFTDYLDSKDFIPDRRHALRKRAGLREKDKRVSRYTPCSVILYTT